MINIENLKKDIREQVTKHFCEKLGVTPDEVKVTFKSGGDLAVTVVPKELVNELSINYEVVTENKGEAK